MFSGFWCTKHPTACFMSPPRTTSQGDRWFAPWRPAASSHPSYWFLGRFYFKHVYKLYARYGKAHFQALLSQQEKRGGSLDVVEKGHSASKHSPTSIKHGHTEALGLIFNAVWGHCRHEVVVLLKDLHSFNNVCFNNVSQLFCNHSVRGKQDRWFCILCDAFFKLATRFTPKFQVSLRY